MTEKAHKDTTIFWVSPDGRVHLNWRLILGVQEWAYILAALAATAVVSRYLPLP